MAKRLRIIFLFLMTSNLASVAMAADAAKTKKIEFYYPYCLTQWGGSLHSKTLHLLYGTKEEIFRYSVFSASEIQAIINQAQREGKYVAVIKPGLMKQTWAAHHQLMSETFYYLCSECTISDVIWVSQKPIKFEYVIISVRDIVYVRDSRAPSFIDDSELWRVKIGTVTRNTWITKSMGNRIRELIPTSNTLYINETAFSAAGVENEPGKIMTSMSAESLIMRPPEPIN